MKSVKKKIFVLYFTLFAQFNILQADNTVSKPEKTLQ